MNNNFSFPQNVEAFGFWLLARYKDDLERKSDPKSIVRDYLSDFSKSGWVPEWVLVFFIAYAQMETNTLIEDVRNRLLSYIDNGDLSLDWKSEALETTISKITESKQNQLRNQLLSFQLCTFKKASLQTLQRGDYCAIQLPNNYYGIVIVVKMLDKGHGIIQFDEALFEKPPTTEEIIHIKPKRMQIPGIGESYFVSTYLNLARVGYWKTGHLQNNLCNQLPVLLSDNGIPIMYPDAVQRQLCRNHGITIPESIYVGINPYIKACRICGKRLKPKDNFGWESMSPSCAKNHPEADERQTKE